MYSGTLSQRQRAEKLNTSLRPVIHGGWKQQTTFARNTTRLVKEDSQRGEEVHAEIAP